MVEKDGKAWEVRFKDINPEWFATTFNIQELYDSTNFPREKEDYYYEEKLITPFVNPFYNNALDMDQQSQDFWENL